MANEEITAAPYPLHLGEREFRATPFSDRDLSELDNWVRAEYMRTAERGAAHLEPDDIRWQALMKMAQNTSVGLSAFTGIGASMIATVDGMARLTWQMIYKNHPDVSVADLRELMFSSTNIEKVNAVFKRLNMPAGFVEPANTGKKGGPDRKTTSRQAK